MRPIVWLLAAILAELQRIRRAIEGGWASGRQAVSGRRVRADEEGWPVDPGDVNPEAENEGRREA